MQSVCVQRGHCAGKVGVIHVANRCNSCTMLINLILICVINVQCWHACCVLLLVLQQSMLSAVQLSSGLSTHPVSSPPAYLPACLPTCLSAYLPAHLPTCLSAYLPAHLPTHLPAHLPARPPTIQPALLVLKHRHCHCLPQDPPPAPSDLMRLVYTSGRPFALLDVRLVAVEQRPAATESGIEEQYTDVLPGSGMVGEVWCRGPTVFSGEWLGPGVWGLESLMPCLDLGWSGRFGAVDQLCSQVSGWVLGFGVWSH